MTYIVKIRDIVGYMQVLYRFLSMISFFMVGKRIECVKNRQINPITRNIDVQFQKKIAFMD